MDEQLVFTFDTNPFKNAVKDISRGFTNLKGNITQFTKDSAKKTSNFFGTFKRKGSEAVEQTSKSSEVSISNFKDNASSMVSALSKKVLGLGAAFLGIKKALTYLPEIGRAFKHAGDIAMRSLMWPLRKVLIPMLQKLIDWARDHRVMFVKWGVAIANAFKTVVAIVKNVINLAKTFVNSFITEFEAVFGKVTKSMTDIANILMFKIAAVAQFIMISLEPVFKFLGKSVARSAELWGNFFEGLVNGFGEIGSIFEDFGNSFSRILKLLGLMNDTGGALVKTFKTLGLIIGGALRLAVLSVAQIVDTLITSFEKLILVAKTFSAWLDDDKEAMKKFEAESEKVGKEAGKRFRERTGQNVTESTIEKIKEMYTPKESSPSKEQKGGSKKIENSVNVGDINVNVKTESDAEKVGVTLGESLRHQLSQQMGKQLKDAEMGVASQ